MWYHDVSLLCFMITWVVLVHVVLHDYLSSACPMQSYYFYHKNNVAVFWTIQSFCILRLWGIIRWKWILFFLYYLLLQKNCPFLPFYLEWVSSTNMCLVKFYYPCISSGLCGVPLVFFVLHHCLNNVCPMQSYYFNYNSHA